MLILYHLIAFFSVPSTSPDSNSFILVVPFLLQTFYRFSSVSFIPSLLFFLLCLVSLPRALPFHFHLDLFPFLFRSFSCSTTTSSSLLSPSPPPPPPSLLPSPPFSLALPPNFLLVLLFLFRPCPPSLLLRSLYFRPSSCFSSIPPSPPLSRHLPSSFSSSTLLPPLLFPSMSFYFFIRSSSFSSHRCHPQFLQILIPNS